MANQTAPKFLAENRRARFDYEILETIEAGLELLGSEVKSVRDGKMNLSGSYVIIRGAEAWLINAQIPSYQPKNSSVDYDSGRTRRVLLKKSEIVQLSDKANEERISLVPLEAYSSRGVLKIRIGIGKSKKTKDKRESIKKREVDRNIARHM